MSKRKSPLNISFHQTEVTKLCRIDNVMLGAILCSTYAHLGNFLPLQTDVNVAGTVVSHDKSLPSQ